MTSTKRELASACQILVSDDVSKKNGLKSNDCHVLMQQLLPFAIKGVLDVNVWRTILSLCHLFNELCSKVVDGIKKSSSTRGLHFRLLCGGRGLRSLFRLLRKDEINWQPHERVYERIHSSKPLSNATIDVVDAQLLDQAHLYVLRNTTVVEPYIVMYKCGSNGETDDMLEFDATFDLTQDFALLDLDDDFFVYAPEWRGHISLNIFLRNNKVFWLCLCDMKSDSASDPDEDSKQRGPTTNAKANKVKLVEKLVVDPKSQKQILQSIGKKWRNFNQYLYTKFINNRRRELKTRGYESDVKMIVNKIDELQKSGGFGEVTCGTHDVLTEALGTQEQRGLVRGMGKFITPEQYFYLPKNVKYYLETENERVDKRINKLEDDLEKLKRGVLNVSEVTSCQVGGVIEDVEKEPWNESLDNSCLLAVEFPANVVAKGTII
ncbi:unnamed protein product [Lactuca saligna]|uniref:Uncharacterized protein n=1 Tax=Lactuca saligna TaxID=75948 RepID=A0AA35ZWC4_LACSI|nr:unnamed protein product [Lactuca saligna]